MKMERNVSLDFLKLALSIMVVALHSGFLKEYTNIGSYLTVNGLFRVAVPLFLIINGYYLYGAIQKGNFKIWFNRSVILYIAWMALYAFFWLRPYPYTFTDFSKKIFILIFGYHHLWYVSGMIVGGGIINYIHDKINTKAMVYCIISAYSIAIIIQYVGNYHLFGNELLDKVFNQSWVYRNGVFFSFPFMAIGFVLNKLNLKNRVTNNAAKLLSVTGLVLLFLEAYLNYINPGREGGFSCYLSLIVVCPSIFIFIAKQEIKSNSKIVALYSSAIFFVHSAIISLLLMNAELAPTLLTLYSIVVSFVISFFVIRANKKVKILL